MVPYFPKQIATKGVYIYLGTLLAVSLIFVEYAMSLFFLLLNVVWVLVFFLLSSNYSKQWSAVPEKLFVKKIFFTALGLRVVWAVFSFFFYQSQTGSPFEFSAGDSLWYYEESMGNRNASLWDVVKYLFIDTDTVSDSGYVFYLSVLSKVTGTSIFLPRLVNSVLSAYTCVLMFRLARRTVGEEGGRITAVFACFMPNFIYYCGLHLKEPVMVFLLVAFLERADYLLKSKKYSVWTIAIPILLGLALFTFRTVLGAAAVFSLATAVVFTNTKVIGKKKRIMLIAWGLLTVLTLGGGVIMNEVENIWTDRGSNQDAKRSVQTARGNQWAKYATGTVMAPMMFVLPFPTMVDVDEQYNQQMISGGNYVRNFFGGFVLLTVFSAIFLKKNWRDFALIGSFAIAYLGIISASGFANSERFLLPGLPVLLILASYGITLLDAKNYRFIKIWYWVVPVMIVGWAIYKLGSRGLL